MKTTLFLILLSNILNYAIADEIKCSGFSAPSTPSSLENLVNDCAIQKNLASDPLVQDTHRKNIYDKLAKKLAAQIKQNSQDTSLLTSFYNANGHDLMMNSNDIAQSCRLDSIKTIENCGGKKTGPFQDMKLKLLKDNLPKTKNTPFENDQSLYGIMAGNFYSDLGMKTGNGLQCPIDAQSGFMLQSQLDDFSAGLILGTIKESISDSITESTTLNSLFEQYPQLQIIKNTNDPNFIASFSRYVKSMPSGKNAKEHISAFFFDPSNQKKLAPAVANQCNRINKNINEFLCSDITEMGSLDDKASRALFNKLNTTESMEDQYEVDFNDPSILTAYGLQCLAKENNAKNPNRTQSNNFQSIDQWFNDFTLNTRDQMSNSASKADVDKFCASYTCQTDLAKKTKSCMKGGPVTSADLAVALGCNLTTNNNNCDTAALKSIAYMKNLEQLAKDSKDQVAATSSSTSSSTSTANTKEEKVVSGRLPNFASNYFGVEGSLKALGKPATPMAISEKKEEFAEKKLATAEPVYKTPEVMKAQQPVSPSMVAADNNGSVRPTYSPTQMSQNSARTQTASSVTPIYEPTIRTATAAKVKPQSPVESDTSNESSRLRDEMEKMIADIKSTKEEITASKETITASENSLGNKAYGVTSNLVSPVNRAEQERLKRLEQSLNDKSNRLEEYRRELDNRNYAQSGIQDDGANRATASNGSGGGGGSAGGTGGSIGGGSAGSGASGSVKLTAGANAKADGKNANTAALIQSGVESSTLSVDELSHLSPDSLKKLGIDSTKPFTLKVTFESKTYEVPVKTFIYKGNSILGPIMNPKNKELNDFLLKSPLFKQYIDYKFEKENQMSI